MDISDLKKNLYQLEGEELKSAKALLKALGISIPRDGSAKPKRATMTTKLKPYVEKLDTVCQTCGHIHTSFRLFSLEVHENQFYLQGRKVTSFDSEKVPEEMPRTFRRSEQLVCKECAMVLSEWTKEELIATLLNLRMEGRYAKITTKK